MKYPVFVSQVLTFVGFFLLCLKFRFVLWAWLIHIYYFRQDLDETKQLNMVAFTFSQDGSHPDVKSKALSYDQLTYMQVNETIMNLFFMVKYYWIDQWFWFLY